MPSQKSFIRPQTQLLTLLLRVRSHGTLLWTAEGEPSIGASMAHDVREDDILSLKTELDAFGWSISLV